MPNDKTAFSSYVHRLYDVQPLTREEEESLAGMIAAGDRTALEKLVRHNLRFVVSVVRDTPGWHHTGVPFEDLVAMGNEALIKAARRWRPRNGARFATYAKQFIQKGVRRSLDNEWSLIRIPVNIAEEVRRMKYTERVMIQELNRSPTDQELADRLRVHHSRIGELRSVVGMEPSSLDGHNQEKYNEEIED